MFSFQDLCLHTCSLNVQNESMQRNCTCRSAVLQQYNKLLWVILPSAVRQGKSRNCSDSALAFFPTPTLSVGKILSSEVFHKTKGLNPPTLGLSEDWSGLTIGSALHLPPLFGTTDVTTGVPLSGVFQFL